MIYAAFTKVFSTRNYERFCRLMEIPFGRDSESYRTPMESKMARQFVLAVNTGRAAVVVNFNLNIAVYVIPSPTLSLKAKALVTQHRARTREFMSSAGMEVTDLSDKLDPATISWMIPEFFGKFD